MNRATRHLVWFTGLVALALLAFLVHVLNLQVLRAERLRAELHASGAPLLLPADPAPVTLGSTQPVADRPNILTERRRATASTASTRSSVRSR